MEFAWRGREYVFGAGLVSQAGAGDGPVIELIPFLAGDGSGQVAGWSLWFDGRRQCECRLLGPIEACRAEAERIAAKRLGPPPTEAQRSEKPPHPSLDPGARSRSVRPE